MGFGFPSAGLTGLCREPPHQLWEGLRQVPPQLAERLPGGGHDTLIPGARSDSGVLLQRTCGETGDQTDQESRSAGHRAAASVTTMDITIHASFLPHDDRDASLAFYRDRPEVVPVVLLLLWAGPG